MWTYAQTSGELFHDDVLMGIGYSGYGDAKNNPALQRIPNVGPIPRGYWTIGPSYAHEHLGVITMNLEPKEGTNTFSRTVFRIHGDNSEHSASHGCIVLARGLREELAASTDRDLKVIA